MAAGEGGRILGTTVLCTAKRSKVNLAWEMYLDILGNLSYDNTNRW